MHGSEIPTILLPVATAMTSSAMPKVRPLSMRPNCVRNPLLVLQGGQGMGGGEGGGRDR